MNDFVREAVDGSGIEVQVPEFIRLWASSDQVNEFYEKYLPDFLRGLVGREVTSELKAQLEEGVRSLWTEKTGMEVMSFEPVAHASTGDAGEVVELP